MAAEETIDHLPTFGVRGDDNSHQGSEEKTALTEFAYRLGAYNCINESGIVDECSTRREAKLLMSLLSFPPKLDMGDLEPISFSESEHSYASDSSTSRRDHFSFTCPSLSLESSERSFGHSHSFDTQERVAVRKRTEDKRKSSSSTRPASLLGRTLKVDDRDALRLSADAMARNIRHSFQSAMDWRIKTWMEALSKTLVRKEKEMKQAGASENELKRLLEIPEAVLFLKLKQIAQIIQVTSTGTSFRVVALCPSETVAEEPPFKRLRLENTSDFEEGEYHYKVSYILAMDCTVCLQTPAGCSEITLQVPGTIEGIFLSSETGMEELRSVVVELDTEILTAMLDKSARTIVRASIESYSPSNHEEEEKESVDEAVATDDEEAEEVAPSTHAFTTMMTPPPRPSSATVSAEDVRAAIVTPRVVSGGFHDSSSSSHHPILLPIPEKLQPHEEKHSYIARRISPQPSSPDFTKGHRFAAPPSSPVPQSSSRNNMGVPLISPNVNDGRQFEESSGNCPSLPLLVEVACREMQAH